MRTPIIAGNWKLNNNISESLSLVKAIQKDLGSASKAEIVVAPTFIALNKVAEFCQNTHIEVAAQNLFWEASGAFTGEIAANMIKEAGANYVIIGHSERRQYFNETDDTVNKKIFAAQTARLIPIVCIGETLAEREADQVELVINTQITQGLANLTAKQINNLVIAYEPVWAIGTGKTATLEQAEAVHAMIRKLIVELYDQATADKSRILYGGSVKPANARELLSQHNIDGALVGGASLKAEDFVAIINAVV